MKKLILLGVLLVSSEHIELVLVRRAGGFFFTRLDVVTFRKTCGAVAQAGSTGCIPKELPADGNVCFRLQSLQWKTTSWKS
jgi:hypothetical protein